MRFLHFFRFHSVRAEAQRKAEMEFRLKMAGLKRNAAAIRKEADRTKAEAISLEKSGDHSRAVAKAAAAANQEKSYHTALNTISMCENIHDQAKTQNALKQLMISCKDMSATVTGEADIDGAIKAQTQLQDAAARLEASQEAMAAFQEGFDLDTDPQVRNEVGEAALAKILEENAKKEQQVTAEPAKEETPSETTTANHQQWVADRRKTLSELIG